MGTFRIKVGIKIIQYVCIHKCPRFITTPSVGVAQALGLQWWIETKAQKMVYICLFRGSGYDP